MANGIEIKAVFEGDMEELKLKRIDSKRWIGTFKGKRFELTVEDYGHEFTLENGKLTSDEFEDVCLRFYHDDYEYVESIK